MVEHAPRPGAMVSMVIAFESLRNAVKAVPRTLGTGHLPLALEYMDRELAEASARKQGLRWRVSKGEHFLYMILDGDSVESLYPVMERIDAARACGAVETYVAMDRRDQDELLAIRSKIYFVLKSGTLDILDLAIPPASIAGFVKGARRIAAKYGIRRMPIFGHAGDGNLHVHIMSEEAGGIHPRMLDEVREELYALAVRMGGTITAEHGVGVVRLRPFLKYADRRAVEVMRGIKSVFDPHNIMNPGKVVPP